MNYSCVKLKPVSPFHLGERESWHEGSNVYMHVDTLFSALCHAVRLLYSDSELTDFLNAAARSESFRLSSAFPYWDDKFFWPIPKNQIPIDKDAYRIRFIETSGLEQMLSGQHLETIMKHHSCIPDIKTGKKPWQILNAPRISLNRLSHHPMDDGGYFHYGRVRFLDNAGLYFLYDIQDSSIQAMFQTAIRLLADEGLGGDRSVGNGLFDPPLFQNITINTPSQSDAAYLLSLYSPSHMDKSSNLIDAYFDLKERKGYIFSPDGSTLRRRTIRMFMEGSVFSSEHRTGQTANVRPNAFSAHNIFRFGNYWSLPCKMEVQ